MSFTPAAFRFLRGLAKNNNRIWFEAHRADYEKSLREPMRELISDMDVRFAKFAPEMIGDVKRSMFRINRDIRFSRDKSPYKTHAACWFFHHAGGHKVGNDGGSAGLYFHLEPGNSMFGAGLWMPPRPQLNKIRDAIAKNPAGFTRMARRLDKVGGLDGEAMLKRVPQGFPETHPAARWLRYQSFTAGGEIADSRVIGAKLPALLEKQFKSLLPLVRWLNESIGLGRAAGR